MVKRQIKSMPPSKRSVWSIRKLNPRNIGTSRRIGSVLARTDREAERKGSNKFKLKEEQIFAIRKKK